MRKREEKEGVIHSRVCVAHLKYEGIVIYLEDAREEPVGSYE